LARGVKYTSKASKAILVRSSSSGRSIIDIDIPKIIKGQLPDQVLQANDVIYVPNSVSKVVILKGLQAAVSVGSAILIYSNH
jgi:polysaccharide export outer membrane protein